MNNPRKYPKIIAHRGASAHAPENTLPAFQLALEQGADGIELDVMLSKDNRLIVIHDSTLERSTNGKGNVLDHSYAELKELDAGAYFGDAFKTRPPFRCLMKFTNNLAGSLKSMWNLKTITGLTTNSLISRWHSPKSTIFWIPSFFHRSMRAI